MCFKKISFILILSTCLTAGHKLMAVKTQKDFYKDLELMVRTKADEQFCQELAKLQARDARKNEYKTISPARWQEIINRTEESENKEVKKNEVVGSVRKKAGSLLVRRSTASTTSQEGSPPDARLKLGRSSNENQKQDI